jgi:multicomponent Na+:H+ antiporter subunit G
MSLLQNGVSVFLVVSGMFFLLLGSVGILRFPDFFTRLHPAGKADTLGASLLLLGLAVHQGFSLLALKIVLVQIFIFMANPAAAHALGRAAWRAGLRPWTAGDGEAVEAHVEAPTRKDGR